MNFSTEFVHFQMPSGSGTAKSPNMIEEDRLLLASSKCPEPHSIANIAQKLHPFSAMPRGWKAAWKIRGIPTRLKPLKMRSCCRFESCSWAAGLALARTMLWIPLEGRKTPQIRSPLDFCLSTRLGDNPPSYGEDDSTDATT